MRSLKSWEDPSFSFSTMRISSVARFQTSTSANPSQLNWKCEEQIAHDFKIETALLNSVMNRREENRQREAQENKRDPLKVLERLETEIKSERRARKGSERQLKLLHQRIREAKVEI